MGDGAGRSRDNGLKQISGGKLGRDGRRGASEGDIYTTLWRVPPDEMDLGYIPTGYRLPWLQQDSCVLQTSAALGVIVLINIRDHGAGHCASHLQPARGGTWSRACHPRRARGGGHGRADTSGICTSRFSGRSPGRSGTNATSRKSADPAQGYTRSPSRDIYAPHPVCVFHTHATFGTSVHYTLLENRGGSAEPTVILLINTLQTVAPCLGYWETGFSSADAPSPFPPVRRRAPGWHCAVAARCQA
ncbi:hypothetical protein AAFF_G00165100 [Aldrovandia affinis]|uniref:Uncharacterized protein n=1 Tax=Aldrovandia affinis TaxID=143900 RepID=A0AAD7RMU0_9TELE|nr:hypothetical protein AAFF_G00165100 [Aldrovandia affinis]